MKVANRDPPASADWWRLWSDLYKQELDAFGRRGATVKPVMQRNGFLILDVVWPVEAAEDIQLQVGFSPLHPFARPKVTAQHLRLTRHQDPFTGGLCLLTQEWGQWDPGKRVADHIFDQLPRVLSAVRLRDEARFAEAAEFEEHAPDPLSPYFEHLAEENSTVFFSSEQPVPKAHVGIAQFICQDRPFPGAPFEALLRSVELAEGGRLTRKFELPKPVGTWTPIVGRWVRLSPPITRDMSEILAAADRAIDRATALQPAANAKLRALGNAPFAITGILFDEEMHYGPGKLGKSWLFLVRRPPAGATGQRATSLVRGQRITGDLLDRVPVASALQRKKVLLVGCGAIGSFVALELARAGVGKLTLADFDVVEPGNSVRWALGRQAWGLRKTTALHDFLYRNYPTTNVVQLSAHIGAATTDLSEVEEGGANPLVQLREEIGDADVIVDASASTECQQALAFNSRDLGRPYVVGYATEGAVGGIVARILPASPSCFVCLQEHWHDRTLPSPPANPSGSVQPVGCNTPTFTGGAFDLQEVSLEMVRSAIGLLAPGQYDPGDWQLSVLTLEKEGRRVLPSWSSHGISPHPRCCGAS